MLAKKDLGCKDHRPAQAQTAKLCSRTKPACEAAIDANLLAVCMWRGMESRGFIYDDRWTTGF